MNMDEFGKRCTPVYVYDGDTRLRRTGRNKKTISMEMGTASSAEAEEARDCEVISGNSLFSASPSVITALPPRSAADAAPVVQF